MTLSIDVSRGLRGLRLYFLFQNKCRNTIISTKKTTQKMMLVIKMIKMMTMMMVMVVMMVMMMMMVMVMVMTMINNNNNNNSCCNDTIIEFSVSNAGNQLRTQLFINCLRGDFPLCIRLVIRSIPFTSNGLGEPSKTSFPKSFFFITLRLATYSQVNN